MKCFRLISAFLFLASLSFAMAGPANAESGSLCSAFSENTQDSWAACTDHPNIAVTTDQTGSIGGPGDWYLKLTDQSGPSAACSSDSKYQGNWVEKAGNCGQFCYDVRIFEIPYAPLTLIYPSITIFSSAGKATFYPTIPATTDAGAHGGWHHICAPVKLTQPGDTTLPSSSDGSWVVSSGGPFNAIITSVNRVLLGVDFTVQPSEVVGYDNICMTPGDCGNETIIKSFTKSAKRDCEAVTYTLRVDVISNGANPQQVFVSDNWPAGLLPATSVQVSGTPAVTANTSLTATGWTVDFNTATSSGSVAGSYEITFTSQLDPAFMSSGDFKLVNQASARVGKDGTPVLSDNPDTSTAADATIVEVLAADLKACNPPPEDVSCLNGTDEVTCGKTPGTYVVTLQPTGAGGVIPDTMQINSLTAGVTVIPAKPAYKVIGGKVKVTLAGANPGDTVKLEVNGVSTGKGSVEGSDLCCNGTVDIVIPKDLPCDQRKPELKISKTCEPAVKVVGAIDSFEANCRIIVSSTGPVTGPLSVSDVLTASGSGATTTAILSAQPWLCLPSVPVAAGTSVTCSLDGTELNSAGGTSVIDVKLSFRSIADMVDAKECAALSYSGSAVGESCASIEPPGQGTPTLTVNKVCEPAEPRPGSNGLMARCQITVTGTGTPLPPVIQIIDQLMGPSNVPGSENQIVAMSSSENWSCPPMPVNVGIDAPCQLPGSDLVAAGGQSVIDVTVQFPDAGNASESRQCVEASGLEADDSVALSAPQVCIAVTASGNTTPTCDTRNTKLVGNQCRCTIEGAVPISKTACGCPDGKILLGGACKPPQPKCDAATTTLKGSECVCRFPRMTKVSAAACSCAKGLDFVAGKGCVEPRPTCKDGKAFNRERGRCEPVCKPPQEYDRKRNACVSVKPPQRCDMTTAVPRGEGCVCRYSNMTQKGASCSCQRGEKFVRGQGCVKPESECREGNRFNPKRNRCEPICRPPAQYDKRKNVCITLDEPPTKQEPECRQGNRFNPKRNRCEPVCRPPAQYDRRKNVCITLDEPPKP